MAGKQGPNKQAARQRATRQAQAAAARRARRQRNQKIVVGAVAVALVAALVVGILSMGGGGGKTKVATSATTAPTPSSVAAAPSVAGKPCVAVADPLPAGAPAVPVEVGPPPTKLVIKDLKPGTGATVTATQNLTVNYIGVSCSTGKIFDSSYSTGQPANFTLADVIPGWQQGIPGMKVGGERLLGIPPDLAYGTQGRPGIAPDETLWFVVDIVNAK